VIEHDSFLVFSEISIHFAWHTQLYNQFYNTLQLHCYGGAPCADRRRRAAPCAEREAIQDIERAILRAL
jgi:hypothetical protein